MTLDLARSSVTLEKNLSGMVMTEATCIREQMVVNFKTAWQGLGNLVMEIWLRNVRHSGAARAEV